VLLYHLPIKPSGTSTIEKEINEDETAIHKSFEDLIFEINFTRAITTAPRSLLGIGKAGAPHLIRCSLPFFKLWLNFDMPGVFQGF
jgi:hypothetical protein